MDFKDVKQIVLPESGSQMDLMKVKGDTEQKAYSGEQLLTKQGMATPSNDSAFWHTLSTGAISHTPLADGWARFEQIATGVFGDFATTRGAIDGMAADSTYTVVAEVINVVNGGTGAIIDLAQVAQDQDPFEEVTIITGATDVSGTVRIYLSAGTTAVTAAFVGRTKAVLAAMGLRMYTRNTTPVGVAFDLRVTVLAGDHSADYENYIGDNWQPYTGGIPAPNPDYPQEIRTVTGRQEVNVDGTAVEVNLGKNLFNKDDTIVLDAYIRDTADTLRVYAPGTNSNKTVAVKVAKNTTYTVSKSGGNRFRVFAMPTLVAPPARGYTTYNILNLVRADAKASATINTGDDEYLYIHITEDASQLEAALDSLQIELGDTATPYAPYFEPIELCKIGDYQDKIYYEGGKWWIEKVTHRYEFSAGAGEYWQRSGYCYKCNFTPDQPEINAGYHFVNYATIGLYANLGAEAPARELYVEDTVAKVGIAIRDTGGGNTSAYISGERFGTANELNNYLRTNPLVIYAVLATPTVTEITEQSLLGGLEALRALGKFGHDTPPTITVESVAPNLPAVVLTKDLINDVVKIEASGATLWRKDA